MLIFLGLCGLCGILVMGPVAAVPGVLAQPRLILVTQNEAPELRVSRALQLADLLPILQQEARREAEALAAEGLVGAEGPPWAEMVAQIHDPDRIGALFSAALGASSARIEPGLLDRALAFYDGGTGARLVALENEARRAMLDPDIEDAARAAFAQADAQGSTRAQLIRRLIDVADLIAPNVATGMNASVAFSQGFAEGGGFDMAPTPDQMLAEAWAQQDEIAFEAEAWMQAFLMLAYSPVTDGEIEEYIAFARSAEGRTLADLMFDGFDAVFAQTSREMGLAAALREDGQRL